jgi:hypothetical protein
VKAPDIPGALRLGGGVLCCGYWKPEPWELQVRHFFCGTANKTQIEEKSCSAFSTILYFLYFHIPETEEPATPLNRRSSQAFSTNGNSTKI